MEGDRWHQFITIGVIASLALSIVGIGIGIKALRKSSSSPTTVPATAPAAAVLYPTNGVTLSGMAALDAKPSSTAVTSISIVATGGSLHDTQIATLAPSIAGWVSRWNTKTVSNGSYQIAAVAYDASGHSSQSSSVNVTVKN